MNESFDYKFRVNQLKEFLKARGLKQSGRKDELTARLIEADPKTMQKAVKELEVFVCTEAGRIVAQEFLDEEEKKRQIVEANVTRALGEHKFLEASKLVSSYEACQVFARGINIDWKNHNHDRDVSTLTYIFTRIPKLLKDLDKSIIETLRIGTGIEYLWGKNNTEGFLKNVETGIHLDSETSARMLWFHALYLMELEQFREFAKDRRKVTVSIISFVNDNLICPECQELNGKKFSLDKVPELPYEKCTSKMGCRCSMSWAGDW